MSTTFFAWTFCCPDLESGRNPPLEKVWATMERPDTKGHLLFTASRNMWLAGTLAVIASRLAIRDLDFLSAMDEPVQRDSTRYQWMAVMLDRRAVVDAIAGVEQILHRAAENPEAFAAALLPERFSAEEIEVALKSSSAIGVPVEGGNHEPNGEEEGDGPVYLFSFLKCLRSWLGQAEAHGRCLIHLRHVP